MSIKRFILLSVVVLSVVQSSNKKMKENKSPKFVLPNAKWHIHVEDIKEIYIRKPLIGTM